MNNPLFRYTFRFKKTMKIRRVDVYLSALEDGHVEDIQDMLNDIRYELVERDVWTGIKDVNDVLIFSGDILKINMGGNMGYVQFQFGEWIINYHLALNPNVDRTLPYNHSWLSIGLHRDPMIYRLEILGNIHENPELIRLPEDVTVV